MPIVATSTVSGVLDTASSVVTSGLSWLSNTVDTVAGTPLLMTFVCIGFIGTGISLLRRIIG